MTKKKDNAQGCPICGKPTAAETRPFCSRRCADVDLGRWLKGTYRVPTDERPEDAPEPGGDPEAYRNGEDA
jgi:endogenous inhibitor of DNA gyrase (YacG/DUF329 family)